MKIFEIINNQYFITSFLIGVGFCILYDIIKCVINIINEEAWKVEDYEKLIAKYLNTYNTDSNKEKKLIATAKENVKKRNARRKNSKNIKKTN